jgi:lipopolysaccharide assembly outer membrane protein LptD (OstA)
MSKQRVFLRWRGSAVLASVLWAAGASRGGAQEPGVTAAAEAAVAAAAGRIDATADEMEYEEGTLWMVGRGHVVIRRGGATLFADYVRYNSATDEASAKGNVVLRRADGAVWRGQELAYNFRSGIGTFGAFEFESGVFRVFGEDSELAGVNQIRLRRVTITTCEKDDIEWCVRAGSATVTDERYVVARNAVFYLGGVPTMYVPWYRKDLHGDGRLDFVPGYSSRLGPFLLTAYNYPVARLGEGRLKGVTHLNLYGERGFGLGQDFKWRATNDAWRGESRAFYIDDNKPYRSDKEREEREQYLTDPQRYRLRLDHVQTFTDRDTLYGRASYLSDPWVLRDFYRAEYEESPQPENRVVLSHRGEHSEASLLVNKRLNDFYDNVDRMPEASFLVRPIRLGDSPVYLESRSAASQLAAVAAEGSGREDYEATRLHTEETLYVPHKYFGFLTLVPRGVYRGTYYSKTLEDESSVTNLVSVVDTNTGETVTSEEVETLQPEAGSDFRNLYDLGLAASFKAFKVLHEGETAWGLGLRHVAEPHADYVYRPEPALRPDNLYTFDEIDTYDRLHQVTFGWRNEIQTRKHGGTVVHSLVDVDVYTTYLIEPDPGQDDFGPLVLDAELRPNDYFMMDVDARYDFYASTLQEFNTQAAIFGGNESRMAVEYRYRDQEQSLLTSELTLFPKAKWSVGAYARYEFEDSRLEEHSYFLRRRFDCVGLGAGFAHEPAYDEEDEDDYRFWVQLWLLALPGTAVQLGG